MKITLIIAGILFHISSLSQAKCIQLISEDGKAVPFSTVIIKGGNSFFISDSSGKLCDKFTAQVKKGDTLRISAVGFVTREMKFTGIDTIILVRRVLTLPEVVMVRGKGNTDTWGTKANPAPFIGYGCSWGFREILNINGRMIFPEGDYKKAEIQSVSFFDRTDKDVNVPVRLRIFLLGEDSIPVGDYLNENLIVQTRGKGWLTIDLKEKDLIVPKQGLAFCIELFSDKEENYYYRKERNQKGQDYTARIYGFSLAMEKGGADLTLTNFGTWNSWRISRFTAEGCHNLVCRVKVKVWR
jgi:hypothetical protein